MIHTYATRNLGAIRGMALDLNKNYLFTGGFDDGEICAFNIDKPGREKYGSRVASLQGKERVRSIAWSSKRMEIFAGTADGAITFWDLLTGDILCNYFIMQTFWKTIRMRSLRSTTYLKETSLLSLTRTRHSSSGSCL